MAYINRSSRGISQVVHPGNPEHVQALCLVQGSPDPLQVLELEGITVFRVYIQGNVFPRSRG